MSHKRKGKVKERNNKMQLYSFNKPIIPVHKKYPDRRFTLFHSTKLWRLIQSRSETYNTTHQGTKNNNEGKLECCYNPGDSDSLCFLDAFTNYTYIIMVMLGKLQQKSTSNYSVFSRICSGYHSGVWNGCWFWYVWGWDLPNADIKMVKWDVNDCFFFSFQTNESFENWMNTCIFFIKAPKTLICRCIHVNSRWIKLYTKIWFDTMSSDMKIC